VSLFFGLLNLGNASASYVDDYLAAHDISNIDIFRKGEVQGWFVLFIK
jgi:hypothetical protein